jgi:hypothetical protein
MEQDKQIESTRRLTMIYAVSYNFPIGSKNVVRRNVTASTEEEALRVAGVNNPTLKAVLLPPTEKEMKEREKAERRAKTYIPGTGVKRYSADGIDKLERATEIIHWVESRISGISATVKVENTTRFAANLLEANGQEFTDTMPGFSYASDLRWYDGLTIYLTEDMPEQYVAELETLQARCGIRADSPTTSNRRNIFCNALAWEMLRQGHKLGGSQCQQ